MIPNALLTTDASLERYEGQSSVSPVYAEPVDIKGRFDGKRRLVKTSDGKEIICSGMLLVRPDLEVPMHSRITIESRAYRVEEILPAMELKRVHHQELLLST